MFCESNKTTIKFRGPVARLLDKQNYFQSERTKKKTGGEEDEERGWLVASLPHEGKYFIVITSHNRGWRPQVLKSARTYDTGQFFYF